METDKSVALISLYVAENYGLRILSSILRKNGYRVIEIYFKDWRNNYLQWPTKYEIENLIGILKQYNVTLTGISVRSSGFMDIARYITAKIKRTFNIPVIWGGMHPTSMPEECIKAADFICIGEAEEAFLEFVNRFFNDEKLNDCLNIWSNENGEIFRNPPRPLIANLDTIPFRDFKSLDKFYIDKKHLKKGDPCLNDRIYLIEASRGCPYNCAFCIIPLLNELYKDYGGYKYRIRSVNNIIQELLQAKEIFPKLKRIRFDDELFIRDKGWLKDFSVEYKKHINLPFDILLHPLTINEENLKILKNAGLDSVLIGVQNTERINKVLYNRYQPNESVIRAANICKKLKLRPCLQLILDDPVSTSEDKKELFRLILSLSRPYELYLFSLTLYPNTPLAKKLIAEGYSQNKDQLELIKKVFFQYRVDLNFKRPKEDVFWISLLVLASKRFIPLKFLESLSSSNYFKRHPFIIKWIAELANIFKISFILFLEWLRGTINLRMFKRWFNLKSLITQ